MVLLAQRGNSISLDPLKFATHSERLARFPVSGRHQIAQAANCLGCLERVIKE
jgi:hypothetical protein